MDLQPIENYSDRELLELILANQFVLSQKVDRLYNFAHTKFRNEFLEVGSRLKIEYLKETLRDIDDLEREIKDFTSL